MSHAGENRLGGYSAPFCHVERRSRDGSRHFVVHQDAPRFVAEVEAAPGPPGGERRGVIRRVCVANSWSGDYHHSGKLLGAALDFFEADTAQGKGDAW